MDRAFVYTTPPSVFFCTSEEEKLGSSWCDIPRSYGAPRDKMEQLALRYSASKSRRRGWNRFPPGATAVSRLGAPMLSSLQSRIMDRSEHPLPTYKNTTPTSILQWPFQQTDHVSSSVAPFSPPLTFTQAWNLSAVLLAPKWFNHAAIPSGVGCPVGCPAFVRRSCRRHRVLKARSHLHSKHYYATRRQNLGNKADRSDVVLQLQSQPRPHV